MKMGDQRMSKWLIIAFSTWALVLFGGARGSQREGPSEASKNLVSNHSQGKCGVFVSEKVPSKLSDGQLRGSAPKDVELRIDDSGGFFSRIFGRSRIVGLDRRKIKESFVRTVKADGEFQDSILQDGTLLVVDRASFKSSSEQIGELELSVRVSFPTGLEKNVALSLPIRSWESTPEQVAVVALMTIASSPHFLLVDLSFLKAEVNALIFAANKMTSSLKFDRRFKDDRFSRINRGTLQFILSNLNSAKVSTDRLLSVVIDSRIRLTSVMKHQMLASASSGLNKEVVSRIDPTIPDTGQGPHPVIVAMPARVVPTQSGELSASRSIDSYLAYYYPWLLYSGIVPYNALYPWWVIDELTSHHVGGSASSMATVAGSFDVVLNRGLDHQNFVDGPPLTQTYLSSDGVVVVLDELRQDPSQLSRQEESLRHEGFHLLQNQGPGRISLDQIGVSNETGASWNFGPGPAALNDNVPSGDDTTTTGENTGTTSDTTSTTSDL